MALTERDRMLLARCLENEPGAWKDFVDRFHGLFVHVVRHTAHARSVDLNADDVDDLCAEVFTAILSRKSDVLRRFRGKSSLATYLTVVARRVAVKQITRRRKAQAMGHVAASQSALEKAHAAGGEQQRIENRDEIERMLKRLSDTDAEIVKQFHLEGKTYTEISSRLGIPINTIGPTLSRARDQMRQRHA